MLLRFILMLGYVINITACQALPKETPVQKEAPNKPVVFKVTFVPKGKGFILNFMDSNFKYNIVEFDNRKDSVHTLLKSVSIQLPTEFWYTVSKNNDLINDTICSVLIFPGDTISMIADTAYILSARSNNSTLNYLNNLFKPMPFREFFKRRRPFENNAMVIKQLLQKRDAIADSIQLLAAQHQLPATYTQAFLQYNNLRYYGDALNMDYTIYKKQYAAELDQLQSLQAALLKDSVLDKISNAKVKGIIYNMMQLGKLSNNIKSGTVFDNIRYIDPRLYKTKAVTGYLLDLVDDEAHTILEKEKLLAKIMPYIDTAVLAQTKQITTAPLADSVLGIALRDLEGRTTTLKELLARNSKKLVLVDFWASWCAPCVSELPSLKRSAKKLNPQMQVISISIDKDSTQWRQGCNKYGVLAHSYLLTERMNNPLIRFFEIGSIPRYLLLTDKGAVISTEFYKPSNPRFEVALMETYRSLQ